MAQGKSVKETRTNPFKLLNPADAASERESDVHVIRKGVICNTEKRGFATPRNQSKVRLVIDAPGGFIPLWAPGTTLRWRFQERSMKVFADPEAAKAEIMDLFSAAVTAWGDAAPVKFAQRDNAWDFEIAFVRSDECDPQGCVLASAFFPDAGQHTLLIYPRMFEQDRKEQIETLAHEIGHVFGLRHFFANISEKDSPFVLFGKQNAFTIMNYNNKSVLTDTDRKDLKELYQLVWSGQLTEINGTEIRQVRPFSAFRTHAMRMVAADSVLAAAVNQGYPPAPARAASRRKA